MTARPVPSTGSSAPSAPAPSSAPRPAALPAPGELGTPLTAGATRVLLLGAGELGKEVALELQRLGAEVVAVDRYPHAPAMQVAHRSHVVDMLDADALRAVLAAEVPHVVVPEIEAIATEVLAEFEATGRVRVVPTARATRLTMDREGIRRLAAEELGLPTSPYRFVDSEAGLRAALDAVGLPCVVKPVMSSSGKGQSVVRTPDDVAAAWAYAQTGGRAAAAGDGDAPVRVIVEGFVAFDSEITLLTVRHVGGTTFCDPVGHVQVDGDYRESWQPAALTPATLAEAQRVSAAVTEALGGWGVFGVELFVVGERVLFSEVSPRPHDTGLVTLVSQDLSEFALHARAVLGLPAGDVLRLGAGGGQGAAASCAVLAEGTGVPRFTGVDAALGVPTAQVRLFGKPSVAGRRRVAVTLARGADVDEARARARAAAAALHVDLV
ncbi:formate-dependent phosphoribosylglycinamide formyltransferase [Cellulomonas hominis]